MTNNISVIYKRSILENLENANVILCLDLIPDLVIPSLKEKQYPESIIQQILTEYKNFSEQFSIETSGENDYYYDLFIDDQIIIEKIIVSEKIIITITYNLYDFIKEEFEEENENDNISITFDSITIKLI